MHPVRLNRVRLHIGEVLLMKILTLSENTAAAPTFGCEHGLSILAECRGRKILFDAGGERPFCRKRGADGAFPRGGRGRRPLPRARRPRRRPAGFPDFEPHRPGLDAAAGAGAAFLKPPFGARFHRAAAAPRGTAAPARRRRAALGGRAHLLPCGGEDPLAALQPHPPHGGGGRPRAGRFCPRAAPPARGKRGCGFCSPGAATAGSSTFCRAFWKKPGGCRTRWSAASTSRAPPPGRASRPNGSTR